MPLYIARTAAVTSADSPAVRIAAAASRNGSSSLASLATARTPLIVKVVSLRGSGVFSTESAHQVPEVGRQTLTSGT